MLKKKDETAKEEMGISVYSSVGVFSILNKCRCLFIFFLLVVLTNSSSNVFSRLELCRGESGSDESRGSAV